MKTADGRLRLDAPIFISTWSINFFLDLPSVQSLTMDALIAKADSIQPLGKKRKRNDPSQPKVGPSKPPKSDKTSDSIVKNTSLPKSLRSQRDGAETSPHYKHIANPKLRRSLVKTSTHISQSKALLSDAIDLLPSEDVGLIQTEGQLERTWRLSQNDIVKQAGGEAARGRIEMKLDGGPYRVRYTKNGRHMAIAGRTGHVASFDTLTGAVHSELQLGELVEMSYFCKIIPSTLLHNKSMPSSMTEMEWKYTSLKPI